MQAVVWSVRVGCQPLCICKSLGNGSWMGAGSLFVCILQSFSLGWTSPLPLLVSPNAIMSVGTASISLSLAPSLLLTLQFKFFESEIHLTLICLLLLSIFLLFIVPTSACLICAYTSVCNFAECLMTAHCEILNPKLEKQQEWCETNCR